MRVEKIAKGLKGERIKRNYARKGRYIPQKLYKELKSVRKCEKCKKKFKKQLEIHHKVPVGAGGTNERSNLMVVCTKCHKKLDAEVLRGA